MFVLLHNGSTVTDGLKSIEEIEVVLQDMSGNEMLIDEEGMEIEVESLLNTSHDVFTESLCEMGDDYAELEIVEV